MRRIFLSIFFLVVILTGNTQNVNPSHAKNIIPGAEAFSGIYQDTGIFTNMPGTYQFDK